MRLYLAIALLFVYAGGWVDPVPVSAATPRDLYHKAEACSSQLIRSSRQRQYRDNWLRCIEKFQAVYRHDPSGPWAAAGLYMSGDLYGKLYRYSARRADKQEAIDVFKRIMNRYPSSRYKQRARAAIQSLERETPKRRSSESGKSTKKAKDRYNQADRCYRDLLKSARKQKYRDNWLQCIDGFQAVYQADPSGPWAAAGLYMTGQLYQELYRRSFRKADHQQSIALYRQIIAGYPESSYRKRSETALGMIDQGSEARVGETPPRPAQTAAKAPGDTEKPAEKASKPESAPKRSTPTVSKQPGRATVTGLRYWSNPSYTRIVIDADQKADYAHRLLKKDPSISKPQRLYVDIGESRLGADIKKVVPINDDLLLDARAGQYTPDTVRVVVDIKSFERYNIFSLNNPFRIVIDLRGRDLPAKPAAPPAVSLPAKGDKKLAPSALAKQLALGVKRIVIDPGHGGRDRGAPGYLKGVYEKGITLKVAKRLARKIRKEMGCEVFLTRETDRYLTLEERTAIANTRNADLFISIHTNAARDRRAHGIMTFILNFATDDESILVAARENATSRKNISDLQSILSQLMQHAKIDESSRLATHVQKSTFEHLGKQYSRIKSKGVRQAPFYVLLGAQMPAILIETSFISNARECRRLVNAHYQEQMSEGILKGIQSYIRETNPTVLLKSHPESAAQPG